MRLISQKGWGYIDIEYENGTITMIIRVKEQE